MEKYEKLAIEVISFDSEDVIVTSDPLGTVPGEIEVPIIGGKN